MPSRDQHKWTGAMIGLAEFVSWKQQRGEEPDLVGAGLSLLFGAFAANIADDLEPPTGPKHRSYLHSWEALAIANQQYNLRSDVASKIFFRAYASHLKDDSKTTSGLPLATEKFLRTLRRRLRDLGRKRSNSSPELLPQPTLEASVTALRLRTDAERARPIGSGESGRPPKPSSVSP